MGPVGRDGGGLQAGQLPVLARCDVHGYAKLRAVATAATARRGFPTAGTSASANRDRARVQPRALHHVTAVQITVDRVVGGGISGRIGQDLTRAAIRSPGSAVPITQGPTRL